MRLLILLALLFPTTLLANNATIPGELLLERPTLISLGVEWRIEGDANQNASAQVEYRKQGETSWQAYLPLFRIGKGLTIHPIGSPRFPYTIPDALAGSVMDLEPNTPYEIRLTIEDPDGVQGEAVQTFTQTTRAEPALPDEAEIRHVYPTDYDGPKEKPAYIDIMHAVNGIAPGCDAYQTIHPNAAKPGTVIRVHPGLHKVDRYEYWDFKNRTMNHTYWLHGTITLTASGTAEEPIYIVGDESGGTVFDGDGCHVLFNLRGAEYLHFENLTIQNCDIAFHGGFQGERGGSPKGLTIRNCWLENIVYGVLAQDGRAEDYTIVDNVILGRNAHDQFHWKFGDSRGGYAVNLAGQGHVVAHNYVAQFWDGINIFTQSLHDPQYNQQSRAIDFYNNDIDLCGDNSIETDGGYANIRVLRNRCFNCTTGALSVQNVFAGPVYFIRNVVWNSGRGKTFLKDVGAAQVALFLHNTTSTHCTALKNKTPFSPFVEDGAWFYQNNLFVGPQEAGGGRRGPAPIASYLAPSGPNRVIDFNGFRSGGDESLWVVGGEKYASREAMTAAAGYDANSIEIADYTIFERPVEPRNNYRDPAAVIRVDEVDARLKEGAAPIDAGTPIAGINDNFAGSAPDLGAYELGEPLPIYGPRTGPYLDRLTELRAGTYIPVTQPAEGMR